jgi:two-component system, NarL family, sensor kinase
VSAPPSGTSLVERAELPGGRPGAALPERPSVAGPRSTAARAAGPRRALAFFLVVAVLALAAVAAGSVLVSREVAERSALDEAERTAVRLGQHLITPALAEALAGVPGRWDELDRRVADRLGDGSIESVAVWIPPGEILFSSEEELEGLVSEPSDGVRDAWAGKVVASVDESLARGRSAGADGDPRVEVHVPLAIGEAQLALEVRFSQDVILRQTELLTGEIIPLTVGSLLLLQVVQIPIATWLVRRLRRHEVERADLLALTHTASERERRSIAADVHDGPVQDLAGVSYALSALRSSVPVDRQPTVDRLVSSVREAVGSLRRLIVDLYPPDLSGPGLAPAVDDLAERLRTEGVDVQLTAEPLPDLAPEVAAAVYRSAKEALVNVGKHACATHVRIELAPVGRGGSRAVRLVVTDDGVGLAGRDGDGHRDGHLGLRMLRERAEDLGGTARVRGRPGGGTSVEVVVPLVPAPASPL